MTIDCLVRAKLCKSRSWRPASFVGRNERAWRIIAIISCAPYLGAEAIAGQEDNFTWDRPARVVMILDPPQIEMADSNALIAEQAGSLIPLLGAIYAFNDSRLDSSDLIQNGRDLIEPFDFGIAIDRSVTSLDENANWQLLKTTVYEHPQTVKKLAHRTLAETGADFLLCTNYTYFVSPGLGQVRLWVSVRAFEKTPSRSPRSAIYERNYEYLSQSRGEALRPFREGEKEALLAAIENQYEQKLAQFPNNKKAYRQDRKKALDAIKDRDTILPVMAFNEGWPGRTFADALQLATSNVTAMIRQDLQDIRGTEYEEAELTTFNGFDLEGKPEVFTGYVVGNQGLNTLYRDKQGNLYSVP